MSTPHKYAFIHEELARRDRAHQRRRLMPVTPLKRAEVRVGGRELINFCSNDYLGLSKHPLLKKKAMEFTQQYGTGSTASRMICGSYDYFERIETKLAALKETGAALILNSGFQANVSLLPTLADRRGLIMSDELNHNSLIQGALLSRCRIIRFRHNDLEHLRALLMEKRDKDFTRILIVTESVFSMDGDTAPLAAICDVAERYGALVLVDEAHATGVVGPQGRGVVAAEGLQGRVTVQMGTLGKALGTFGAFVVGRRAVVDLLINTARSFIYTTALPPPVVAGASAALTIACNDAERRRRLHANAAALHAGFQAMGLQVAPRPAHILPVLIGESGRTMHLSERLLAESAFVQGIRPPTVPPGTGRLRVTAMSTHTPEDLQFALAAFNRVFAEAA